MASITKKSNSRFWFACFRDVNGRQRRRSTFQTDRKKALKVAEGYEQVATRKRSPMSVRETIAKLYRETYGEQLPIATVREFIGAWIKEKESEVAPATMERYKESAKKLLIFLGDLADHDLNVVNRRFLIEFRGAIAKQIAPGTANLVLGHVRMIFKAAKRDSYIVEDPTEFLEPVYNSGNDGRRPFTIPEIQRVLEIADDEWKSLILCGLYTGQRLYDLAALTWDNVDLVRSEIRLKTRKTGKRLILPIAPPLRKHLDNLPQSDIPGAPLHARAFDVVSRQGRSGSLSNQFVALLTQAGFREKKTQGAGKGRSAKREVSKLSFHSLRHTAVSLLKDAGIPEAVVMEMIGHDSEQMSAHYTHVGREALEKAAAALPEV
jgi:integrase